MTKKLTKKQIKEQETKKEAKQWEVRVETTSDKLKFILCDSKKVEKGRWTALKFHFDVTISPTGNCQLLSISKFATFNHSLIPESIQEVFIKAVFDYTYSICSKKMLLIDVKQGEYGNMKGVRKMIKCISKFNPHSSVCYNSSNGSRMMTCVLKLDQSKYRNKGYRNLFYSFKSGNSSTFDYS